MTIGLFFAGQVSAQESWSLAKCIEYARLNNLSVKQAQYTIENAKLDNQWNQFSRLPTVSGRASAGYQFGRTIDPFSNTFVTERVGFNSYGVDASMTLYAGNRINNSIKQSKIDLESAHLQAQATVNDISLSIANAYLNILLAQEQLDNAQNRLRLSQNQLEQTDKLINAGTLPPNDRLDIVAQIAIDEQGIIEAQNLVTTGYLNLKQLMEIDPNTDIQIVRPDEALFQDMDAAQLYNLDKVYSAALQTQPGIRAADLDLESAKLGENIARGSFLPTLSLFGGLSTNYSTAAKNPIFGLERFPTTIYFDDVPTVVDVEQFTSIGTENISFTDQINENFGQNFGVSLGIPIYSNHQNKINLERARLATLNTEVTNRQLRQQLKSDVQLAITNARASSENLKAAQRSLEATEAAFDNAQKRFDLGAINTLEFITARNNYDISQVELIRSRYQHLFNLKIIDFYLGNVIQLD
ncbi:MAG TPA: TolC family protein [Saprospiraceae bacterium]|nr:TolC family protein [Saprospiraceae bacterium]HMQ83272.1 TolC family protein [Saprospiraceae bacterium]